MLITESISKLLWPKSIAIIGASSNPGKMAGRPTAYLSELKFAGQVYPVTPVARILHGYKCFPSVRDIPANVDAALIVRPATEVLGAVQECLDVGIKAFVILSGGFAEAGPDGVRLQARLREMCLAAGAVLCGPNGTGLANFQSRSILSSMSNLVAEFKEGGSIALISNSGSIAAMVYQGCGGIFNLVVSTGNEAVLTTADYIAQAIEDPQTSGVVAFVESIRNPDKLIAAAQRASRLGKPIAILKAGRTRKAAEVAASHTGALLNDDAVVDAVFRRHNILRVNTIQELKDVALLIHASRGKSLGTSVGIVTPSGGTAVLMADILNGMGLTLAELSPGTTAEILTIAPEAAAKNPMDVTGFAADPLSFGRIAEVVLKDPKVDILISPMGGAVGATAAGRAHALTEIARQSSKLVVPIWQATSRNQVAFDEFVASGLPVFTDYVGATRAISYLARYQENQRTALEPKAVDRVETTKELLSLIDSMVTPQVRALNEIEVKKILSCAGVNVPNCHFPLTGAEAIHLSFPAVLKVVSREILHKSAVGGVKIVRRAEDVASSLTAGIEAIKILAPHAPIEGFLLEEMVLGGLEFFIGVKRDLQFGLAATFGVGGTLVEAIANVETVLLPVNRDLALEMVWRVTGDQKSPFSNCLSDAIVKIAAIAEAIGDRLAVFEINPIKVVMGPDEAEVVALDGVVELLGPSKTAQISFS
jgi:acetate---CoA ligase (ADP-forming)